MIQNFEKLFNLVGIPSIESIEGYTFREVLAKFQQKIIEVIDEFNSIETRVNTDINGFRDEITAHKQVVDEQLAYLLGTGLQIEVAKEILRLYEDGTLAEIIQEQVFENLTNQINQATEILDNLKAEYDNFTDNVKIVPYKSISVTIANSNMPSEETFRQIKEMGIGITLCPMVNIESYTATTMTLMSKDDVKNFISYSKGKGINITMIKPHLGINWSDGTYRPSINPNDYAVFLQNWKTVLLHYAQICQEENIPILCIGCEMDKLVQPTHKLTWENICNEIRNAYPDLKLTYATTTEDFIRRENATCGAVDFIGVNLYLQWNTNPYNSSMTYLDIVPSFFESYAPISGGFKANDRINELSNKYKKPVFITEIGVIPRTSGLQVLKPSDYADRNNENFEISKIVIQAFFETLCKNNNLTGFALWHVKEPFNLFKYDATIGNSVCTDMIKDYVTGGRI